MMLKSSNILLIIGTFLIAVLIGMIALYSPMPEGLATVHARAIPSATIDSCASCHASGGLAQGCLGCHREIAGQVEAGSGFHGHLLAGKTPECGRCHHEHVGSDFPLINEHSWGAQVPAAFRHPHVQFGLVGKHTNLACEECHLKKLKEPFALPDFRGSPRHQTYLGLSQDCQTCHPDVHSSGKTGPCADCHGQEFFRPTIHFDHAVKFPLLGGHDTRECRLCHLLPAAAAERKPFPFPFDNPRGKGCRDCHNSPHLARWEVECKDCHPGSDPKWASAGSSVTIERHAASGFRLLGSHAEVACDRCHPRDLDFRQRYPDPSSVGYARGEDTCEGCHGDVHRGQFQGRFPLCLECHERAHFMPSTFGFDVHARKYPLSGAHRAVSCIGCHQSDPQLGARRFTGTPHPCKACHDDPHGGQFQAQTDQGDCVACHNQVADTFLIRPFDHTARTSYPLRGAHAKAECNLCHVEVPMAGPESAAVRRYKETPTQCSACHKDVHLGQFEDYGPEGCATCHPSFSSWNQVTFDHDRQSRFPLRGAHSRAPCARCHKPVQLTDGTEVVQYKPLGTDCSNCHDIPATFSPKESR